jgi:hypothetical protein
LFLAIDGIIALNFSQVISIGVFFIASLEDFKNLCPQSHSAIKFLAKVQS